MKFQRLSIPEVVLIEPKVFADDRGFFLESYQRQRFAENGISEEFVQDNHSCSLRGVVRGLHYQTEPFAQGKLVRAGRGAIFDVAVDLRPDSPTYGKWVGATLDAKYHRMLYVPAGFAHGFCALEDPTEVLYKATNYYSPQHERGLLWNDPDIGIAWPQLDVPFVLSAKDQVYPRLRELKIEKLSARHQEE